MKCMETEVEKNENKLLRMLVDSDDMLAIA